MCASVLELSECKAPQDTPGGDEIAGTSAATGSPAEHVQRRPHDEIAPALARAHTMIDYEELATRDATIGADTVADTRATAMPWLGHTRRRALRPGHTHAAATGAPARAALDPAPHMLAHRALVCTRAAATARATHMHGAPHTHAHRAAHTPPQRCHARAAHAPCNNHATCTVTNGRMAHRRMLRTNTHRVRERPPSAHTPAGGPGTAMRDRCVRCVRRCLRAPMVWRAAAGGVMPCVCRCDRLSAVGGVCPCARAHVRCCERALP